MSESANLVSIFCGKFPTEQAFLDYIEFDYSVDDDVPPSQFMADYAIDWYDEDLAETSFIETGSLFDNLCQHSYSETFDNQAKIDSEKFNDYNSLYLIYDFDANEFFPMNAKLTLMGVYAYEKLLY